MCEFATLSPFFCSVIVDWVADFFQGSDDDGEWCDVVPGLGNTVGDPLGGVMFAAAGFAPAGGLGFVAFFVEG